MTSFIQRKREQLQGLDTAGAGAMIQQALAQLEATRMEREKMALATKGQQETVDARVSSDKLRETELTNAKDSAFNSMASLDAQRRSQAGRLNAQYLDDQTVAAEARRQREIRGMAVGAANRYIPDESYSGDEGPSPLARDTTSTRRDMLAKMTPSDIDQSVAELKAAHGLSDTEAARARTEIADAVREAAAETAKEVSYGVEGRKDSLEEKATDNRRKSYADATKQALALANTIMGSKDDLNSYMLLGHDQNLFTLTPEMDQQVRAFQKSKGAKLPNKIRDTIYRAELTKILKEMGIYEWAKQNGFDAERYVEEQAAQKSGDKANPPPAKGTPAAVDFRGAGVKPPVAPPFNPYKTPAQIKAERAAAEAAKRRAVDASASRDGKMNLGDSWLQFKDD